MEIFELDIFKSRIKLRLLSTRASKTLNKLKSSRVPSALKALLQTHFPNYQFRINFQPSSDSNRST